MSVSHTRIKQDTYSWKAWPLKIVPLGCAETSITNYSCRGPSQKSDNLIFAAAVTYNYAQYEMSHRHTHTSLADSNCAAALPPRLTLLTGTQLTFSFTSSSRATRFAFSQCLTLGWLSTDRLCLAAADRPLGPTGCLELPLNSIHLEGAWRGLVTNLWANGCESIVKVKGTSIRPGFQEIKNLLDVGGNKRFYQRILETALTDS
jgi:hypothetical protein